MKLTINGTLHEIKADPATPLVYILRNQLGLMGAKLGCGLEQCGACTVLVDGEAVMSCVRAASEFEGQEITTIEGLSEDALGARVQQAFLEEGAAQCGYCTAGIIIATTALIAGNPDPDKAAISEALSDHLCRCGSQGQVLKAIGKIAASGGAS
jgi:aerobic-type carbon monoxide dehydrogenase small subunit (CoxS/CutS family)